jgi:hypothetical protein
MRYIVCARDSQLNFTCTCGKIVTLIENQFLRFRSLYWQCEGPGISFICPPDPLVNGESVLTFRRDGLTPKFSQLIHERRAVKSKDVLKD